MGQITILSSEISNKIAAGEVVERPVSVVKELVENSIDAGADVITVEIKHGGHTYIRVTDNGSGMSEEDAKIAFLRHATSKIKTENDLDAIYTLGFRGEALSSIGAVAEVDLFTKTKQSEAGVHVICHGGKIISSAAAGTPDGTTFVVKDLFYNTPARMKFLKKDATEAGYISDIMSRFILAHPEISFKLIHNGKEQLFSSGDNQLIHAVYTVYGKDYANACIPVNYVNEHVKITGVAGKGDASRPNRNYQSYFVNKRYIKSPLILRAVEDAYKNQVMIGKFPMAVLNIEINPALIDINVHPTKLEVKFSNEKIIYETVYFGVKNALYSLVNIPKIERRSNQDSSIFVPPSKEKRKQTAIEIPAVPSQEPSILDVQNDIEPAQQNKAIITQTSVLSELQDKPTEPVQKGSTTYDTHDDTYFESVKQEAVEAPAAEVCIVSEPEQDFESAAAIVKEERLYRVVGQIFKTYIIVECDGEMLMIDQHAAHERLKYEELKQNMENSTVNAQCLLVPAIVNLTATEYAVFCEHKEFFREIGFETDEFGDNSIIVRTTPELLSDTEIQQVIVEMITQLERSKGEIITEKKERAMYTMACKAAVKANRIMSQEEMKALADDVFALENINTCPHGRPIIVSMTKHELEKEFKRIV